MKAFRTRADLTEIIDDPTLPAADFEAAIGDLEKVNRLLHAYAPTFRFLRAATRGMSGFRLVDAGSGRGDFLRAIARWAARRGLDAELVGVDLSPAGKLAAEAATPAGMNIRYVTADIFAFQPDPLPDFVVSSLFTHHLPDAGVVRFLRWMEANARRSWHINDLHRHPLAWAGFSALGWLMRWHPITRHDGAISVRRAFARTDWERLLAAAEVPRDAVAIAWRPMFRYAIDRHR